MSPTLGCRQTVVNNVRTWNWPSVSSRHSSCKSRLLIRADERTRTADLISLRVIGQALQRCAGDCKCRMFRGVSFPCLARRCTVLRSRWYQCGIRTSDKLPSDGRSNGTDPRPSIQRIAMTLTCMRATGTRLAETIPSCMAPNYDSPTTISLCPMVRRDRASA